MSLIFVLALLTVAWLLYNQYFKALLNQGKAGKIKIALIALGIIFLLMAVTGRAHALFAVIGAALTQVMRFAPLLVRFFPAARKIFSGTAGSSAPTQSQVSTTTLTMTLDHSSGTMDGTVLAGEFEGRVLQSLSLEELKNLYAYCESYDPEAARLLMSYVSRERADSWDGADDSKGPHSGSAVSEGQMSQMEALQILGLEGDVTKKEIVAAHRSLMGKFHPDKGGNTYLATKLNNARDTLIDSLKA